MLPTGLGHGHPRANSSSRWKRRALGSVAICLSCFYLDQRPGKLDLFAQFQTANRQFDFPSTLETYLQGEKCTKPNLRMTCHFLFIVSLCLSAY
jgi:hypothetical protein